MSAPAQAAVTPSPAPWHACPPGIGVGLLQYPQSRAKDPRAREYVIDHVSPGKTFSRKFQVCNGTADRLSIQLYAAAASIQHGSFTSVSGREGNELTRSIEIAPPSLTLAPDSAGVATATFRIPRDMLAGEQYAVLYAEAPPSGDGPVSSASRAGIRVYLDVGTGGEKPSDFRVDTLQASRRADGTPVVTARVVNTGARALDLRGQLRLSDGPGGLNAGPFTATLGTTLAIGDTEPLTVVLPKAITGGPWTAQLSVFSGVLERRAEGRITFPDANGTSTPPVKAKNIPLAKDRRVLIPIAGGLIGILLLLLWFFWLFAKKRSKRRETDEEVDARRAAAQ
jgi:hypothetical protein